LGSSPYASSGVYSADASHPATTTVNQPIDTISANDYVSRGEQAFQSGNYQQAIHDWQHSLIDNPNNGGVMLLMAQALFAMGQFEQAAGAVQMAMQMLPENEWGLVVKNYTQIYPNIGNYTTQLKALEQARDAKPEDAANRFLLGYHFGYLGYPRQAVRELDKALDLQPQDLGSEKLRDMFASQAGMPARPHAPRDNNSNPAGNPAGAPGGAAPTSGPALQTPPAAPETIPVPQPAAAPQTDSGAATTTGSPS